MKLTLHYFPLNRPDIEIEQKFLVPDDVDDRLLAAGFMQSKSEEKINDIYFDTDEFQLLLKVIRIKNDRPCLILNL